MMQRTLTAFLFLLGGSMAWGQSLTNPTINYQGRANDGDGPLTGSRQVTVAIYDAATGGNQLFTETHSSINFSDAGIFTVAVGSETPGGIPEAIDFTTPKWLGVTVSGFNNGEEIPRLIFRGSPYSLNAGNAVFAESAGSAETAGAAETATFADSSVAAHRATQANHAITATQAETAEKADSADFAKSLTAPASVSHRGDEATLTVVKEGGKGIALDVDGGLRVSGGVETGGVCGTTEHFISGGNNGGSDVPDKGGLYRDNTPIAWGTIQADGSILADFGVATVKHEPTEPGRFIVELDNDLMVDGFSRPLFSVIITPRTQASQGSQPIFAGWDYALDESTNLPQANAFEVYVRNIEVGVDVPFNIVVFGRPAAD